MGVGVDSYVRYAGNPPGGIAKLLRSEFELDPLRFPVLSAVRQEIPRGACCLWCEEIFSVHIKPTVERVVFGIAPMLTMIDGLQQGLDDGRLSEERIAGILLRNRSRFARLASLATDLQLLMTELGGRIGIMRTLLRFPDHFFARDGIDTGVSMDSVGAELATVLRLLPDYIQICDIVVNHNAISTLTFDELRSLKTIDLSGLVDGFQHESEHVLYVRNRFNYVKGQAEGVVQNLFEGVLNDGTLESNGPHNAPSINLFYRSNPAGVVMKAELSGDVMMTSWYDRVTDRLIDRRPTVQRVKLGFSFDGARLFYGTMFPVTE